MPMLSETAVCMTAAELCTAIAVPLPENAETLTVSGFSTDTRTIAAGNCFLALKGENFNGNAYAKQAAEAGAVFCILTEPPQEQLPVPYVLTDDAVKAYGCLANAYLRKCKQNGLRVIGVTGSSGKTTVKDMTAHVLSAKYRTFATSGNHNNHIGVPYTLLHMPAETEVAVVEMGMNHAGEISRLSRIAEPDFALITNIGTAHIGNLGSQENILHAKLEILDGMQHGTLLLPADDVLLRGAKEMLQGRATLRYSTRCGENAAELSAFDISESAESTRFSLRLGEECADAVLPMTGLHNVTDALLAVHAGLCCGMTLAECADALRDFTPGAMRSERVQIGTVMLIRDYYNANPEAMTAALTALQTIAGDAKKIAVLGNMNELGDYAAERHRALGEQCRNLTDDAFFCGESYRDFAEGYGNAGRAFAAQDDLTAALLDTVKQAAGTPLCILIKGSRGVHMERVSEALETMLRAE